MASSRSEEGVRLSADEVERYGVGSLRVVNDVIERKSNTQLLQTDETRNRQILERIPAGRWGHAGAALFLSSAASNYVTGSVLTVDGGWMGR